MNLALVESDAAIHGLPGDADAVENDRRVNSARYERMMTTSRRGASSRTVPFTPLQGQYLVFMHTYEGIHGCAPAEADLQRHFGVTPPSVHQMVVTLERKGLISRVAGVARSIKLQIAPAALPPLEHREKPPADRQRSQLGAIRSQHAAERSKRSLSSRVPPTRVTKLDTAAEYVDSPQMTKRLRVGRSVSAEIAGRYGDYRTRLKQTRSPNGDCTCPSDDWPCKHVRALSATWKTNPASFLDVEAFVRGLDSCGKAELIETIGKIIVACPQALTLFGVAGFDATDTGDDGWAD